jgi:hypothetical protein
MKHKSKFSQEQQNQMQHSNQSAGHEFAGPEQALRFDASRVTVPPEILARLQQSTIGLTPPPKRSWWRNMLGQ